MLTIVMYHYVRELKHSRFPEIRGLSIDLFREQIEFILKHYTVVTMEEVTEVIENSKHGLPNNALLLTFDDGYIDHYTNVFPILNEKKIQGSFFPPAKVVMENKVLDVNKVHFILASVTDKNLIVQSILSIVDKYRQKYSLEEGEYYLKRYAKKSRFDTKEVIFIKRMLQMGLPEELRGIIVDYLFNNYVTKNEKVFAKELYMNLDQIKCMNRLGMFFGSHAYEHYWLNTLEKEKQEEEIDKSIKFLKEIGCNLDKWVMCYPYGGYDSSLLDILQYRGCKLGLTTKVDIANLQVDNPLTLPRLDTNDIPKSKNAKHNKWTQIVME